MKAVYRYDEDFNFIPSATKIVDDDYQLSVSETFTQPKQGLYKAKYDLQNDDWVGEDLPAVSAKINPDEKLLSTLTKQIMDLQLAGKHQEATLAELTKQLMTLQMKGEGKDV